MPISSKILRHLGIDADDVLELLLVGELLLQLDVLLFDVLFVQRLVDDDLQLFQVERLHDVVFGAELHGLDGVVGGGVGRDHDHRQLLIVGLDLLEQLDAVEVGHADVGDDQVVFPPFQLLERVQAAHRLIHLVALLAQDERQHVAQAVVVIDQQNVYGLLKHITTSVP